MQPAEDPQAPAGAGHSTSSDGTAEAPQSDIIVTGAARPQRRFDVSYAVNSLMQEDILRISPKYFADLLRTVPGIQVEATGGEVQNITRFAAFPTTVAI